MPDLKTKEPSIHKIITRLCFTYKGSSRGFFSEHFNHFVFSLFSLGLYAPWAQTELRNYFFSNLFTEGTPFHYRGTGFGLLKELSKLIFFYGFLYGFNQLTRALFPEGQNISFFINLFFGVIFVSYYSYSFYVYSISQISWRGVSFYVDPNPIPYMLTFLKGFFTSLLSLGFSLPVWNEQLLKIKYQNTYFGHQSLKYRGRGRDTRSYYNPLLLFSLLLISPLLINVYYGYVVQSETGMQELKSSPLYFLVTLLPAMGALGLALGYPYLKCQLLRYRSTQLFFLNLQGNFNLDIGALYLLYLKHLLLTIFSLGLLTPVLRVSRLAFYAEHFQMEGFFDLGSFLEFEKESAEQSIPTQ